jgi:hypothetical protein
MALEIPDATSDALRNALQRFDQELRDTPDWHGWEQAHDYAIIQHGKYYPIKQIISLATGADVNSFYGGMAAIRYLLQRRLLIAVLNKPTEATQPDRPFDADWNWGTTYAAQLHQSLAPWGPTAHIQVRRLDGSDDIPKATLQRIKDDLLGPHVIAVEFFPSGQDAALTDAQRHLWAIPSTLLMPNGSSAQYAAASTPIG